MVESTIASDLSQKLDELNLSRSARLWADTLIKNETDLVKFSEFYRGRMMFAIMSYREYKLANSTVSLEEFKECFHQDKSKALEDLFLHPIQSNVVSLLDKRIKDGEWTLDSLYIAHKTDPNKQLSIFVA